MVRLSALCANAIIRLLLNYCKSVLRSASVSDWLLFILGTFSRIKLIVICALLLLSLILQGL